MNRELAMLELLHDWKAWSGVDGAAVAAFVVGLGLAVVACVGM